ncbi:MAG: YceH family protein [Ignavibacteria bacterium]|jgi:uncharacterized protein YceH (UPF0502 family)
MEILSPEEVRTIGSLIEKEHNTPEYYPLTINSLTNACNQKSSRNPVVSYDELLVETTIQKLRDKKLIAKVTGPDQRVPKYKQIFTEFYNLTTPQIAVICILFLRGPQTIGEIKSRSYRIYEFKDLAETENTLEELINIDGGSFVVKLSKDTGRENRYTHLFSREPELSEESTKKISADDRIKELEQKVNSLEEMCNSLKEGFEKFKKEFE